MTLLWRGTEFLKAVLKAELCFHRYVHFACVPIYIYMIYMIYMIYIYKQRVRDYQTCNATSSFIRFKESSGVFLVSLSQ